MLLCYNNSHIRDRPATKIRIYFIANVSFAIFQILWKTTLRKPPQVYFYLEVTNKSKGIRLRPANVVNLQSWQLALINDVQVLDCFMEKSMFQLRYLTLIFVYHQYVKTYSNLFMAFIYFFFCFYCVTEMLNSIQDQRKVKSFLFLVVTGM